MTPVFVFGTARNGTTWLVNALSKNSNICVVEHWLHHGAHEANFGKAQNHFSPFHSYEKYLDFLGRWSVTDFFVLAEGDLEYFKKYSADDYYDVFFELMDSYARKHGVDHWAVKVDPFIYWHGEVENFLNRVGDRYRDARYIAIGRDDFAAVASYLAMEGPYSRIRKRYGLASAALGFVRQKEGRFKIREIIKKQQGLDIKYERLVNDFLGEEKKIDAYLGLEYSLGSNLSDRYRKNTSFSGERQKLRLPSYCRICSVLAQVRLYRRIMLKVHTITIRDIKVFSYRISKLSYRKELLARELKDNNAKKLLKTLTPNE